MTQLLVAVLAALAWAEPPADPEALVTRALSASPSVEALRHQEAALRRRAAPLGAWPDPVVSIEYSNAPVDRWTLSDHPMSGLQLRVQQQLRTPGWSGHSRAVGSLRADVGAHAVAEAELQLGLAVRSAWWSLARTRALEQLTEEHLRRAEELLDAVRSRYETGAVGQHAVLRLEVLRDRLSDQLGDFERGIVQLQAALDEALSDDAPEDYPTPARIEPVSPPADADWTALADAHRPRLASLLAEVDLAEASAKRARLEGIPDPTVWAGYRVRTVVTATDPGTDFVSIGVGVPIPTGSGRRAASDRDAALQEAMAARARHRAARDDVAASVISILAAWARADAKARRYEQGLIPAARAALDTARADFSVGRAELASLFDAEVALIDLERARVAAVIETHVQHAEATAALGVDPSRGAP